MRRPFVFILAFLMGLSLLSGCGSDSGDGTGSAVANGGVFSETDVIFAAEGGSARYMLIRTAGISDDAAAAVQSLYVAIKSNTGVTGMRNSVDENVEYSADAPEILVGRTNRPESATALQYLEQLNNGRKDDFIIATVGNKVVINSFNDTSLVTAVNYFIENYSKGNVTGGIMYTYLTQGDHSKVTVNGSTLGLFKIVRPAVNFSYVTQMQIEELIKKAESQYGYRLVCGKDDQAGENGYEIIVGPADREGVEAETDADKFSIRISGKKIYLSGGSTSAEAMAVSEFAKMLSKGVLTDADSIVGSYRTAAADYDTSEYYTRVWGDDFNGTDPAADPTLWYTVPEGEYSSKGHYDRTAVRTDDTNYVYVRDGKFTVNCSYDDTRYIGGMLMTDRTMLFKYGYVEMSAILPDGNGLWTSLWLDSRWHGMDETDTGLYYDMEIDVNECFGKANVVAANCHRWPTDLGKAEGFAHTSLDDSYSNDKKHYTAEGETFNDQFHTFGMLWDEDEFSFTNDGEIFFTYKNNTTEEDIDAFHQLCYLRLSAAVGFKNNSLKIVADDSEVWYTTNKFIVDHVHLYQIRDGKQQIVLRDGSLG